MATPLRAGVLIAPFIGLFLLFIAGWTGFAPSLIAIAEASNAWVNQGLGWAFIAVGLAVILITVFAFIRLDSIRIGGPETRAAHGSFTAIAIGVAASTSLGLLFWATAEPLYHVHQPPRSLGIQPLSDDAQIFARVATVLHWAIIAHVLNALSMMVFGLAAQNLGRRPTVDGVIFRSERPRAVGTILDGALVFFATLVAVGAFASCILALSGEMARFGQTGPNPAALFALALAMGFVIFVAGARPIRTLYSVLARAALILMIVLMAVTLLIGPSSAILGGGLRTLWQMLWTLPGMVTFSGISPGDPWPQTWTINHWGSEMMLAPVIGLFLSRAARGFRVGQAVLLFSIIPAGITMLWITIFGGLAITVDEQTGGAIWTAISRGGADDATYAALWSLPGGESLVVGFVFLIALAFATFAASLLYAIMRVCAPGADDDPATGGARYSVATIWSAGVGLAGWGLASVGTGPVADTIARLGALPALILTIGLLFAALRLCARPRLLNDVKKPEPVQIELDLNAVLPNEMDYDDVGRGSAAPSRETKEKRMTDETLFIGGGGENYATPQELLLRYGNRHGLIAGATGTGKTVSLQILAEGFSKAGVPVFMADVKGDLAGLAAAGTHTHKLHDKLIERAETIGFDDYGYEDFPVVFWDVFGKQGHPVRATISEMGPLLLARLLDLNETQEGVLNIAFALADDQGMLLLDLKDLRAMLNHIGENASELSTTYGYVTKASVGAIQRRLLVLEQQGGKKFFGEPALELKDMIAVNNRREGQINILAADQLVNSPNLYATFLLWLLSELFEELPEVGDPDKPVFVFFFDEAHLLFEDAPKALIEKVEMVARLIRSKGVGVYFITQNPADLPDDILGQLGNRIQHALRAYTPRDQKALKAAANTFRPNPNFKAVEAIPDLGTGEALVSTMGAKGAPSMVERTLIRPPSSRLGPIKPAERKAVMEKSPVFGFYDKTIDRKSAFEMLTERANAKAAEEAQIEDQKGRTKGRGRRKAGGEYRGDDLAPMWQDEGQFNSGRRYTAERPKPRATKAAPKKRASNRQSVGEAMMKSFARSMSSSIGRKVARGILGGLFSGR